MRLFFSFRRALNRQERYKKKEDLCVPMFLIISPTAKCNLSCKGCYSKSYSRDGEISTEQLDKLVLEAKEMGTFFYVIAGGEPLLRKDLFELYSKHRDVVFLVFTNGMLIDKGIAEGLSRMVNVATIISIEGFQRETDDRRGTRVYERVLNAMKILRRYDLFFGFSTTVSRLNIDAVIMNEFLEDMIRNGCRMGTYVDYIPCDGKNEFVMTPEERVMLRNKILEWQKIKGLLLFQLPEDEYMLAGKCLSAGNGFLHITSQGYVEPCPFVHYAAENIKDSSSFREILRSSFLRALREKESVFSGGELGCGLFENLSEISRIAGEHNAVNTISQFKANEDGLPPKNQSSLPE